MKGLYAERREGAMRDHEIIELYWARNESAITATAEKYGNYCHKIIPPAPEFIGLEKAKQIALEDAGLDEAAQKIVFTREELSRNQGKPCYILEFYTDKCAYSYKIDAVSGEIIGKKTEWFSRQESETVPDTSQNSDSKQRRGN